MDSLWSIVADLTIDMVLILMFYRMFLRPPQDHPRERGQGEG